MSLRVSVMDLFDQVRSFIILSLSLGRSIDVSTSELAESANIAPKTPKRKQHMITSARNIFLSTSLWRPKNERYVAAQCIGAALHLGAVHNSSDTRLATVIIVRIDGRALFRVP